MPFLPIFGDKYIEEVEIIDVIIQFAIEGMEQLEDEVLVSVKGLTLRCYDPDGVDERGSRIFKKGCITKVRFYLLTDTWGIKNSNNKFINPRESTKDKSSSPVDYTVSGQLVALINIQELNDNEKRNYSVGIVDCGVFLEIQLPKNHQLRIGDNIMADGRIDIYKYSRTGSNLIM
jgi:hypothetical protein